MKDKICLVTGANAGIGWATTLGLAKSGAAVVMVCRSEERGKAAQEDIQARSGNTRVDLLLADLSVQDDVRQLAQTVQEQYGRLHVLINNAAIIPDERTETADGIEMQLAVNHLAPFLLTNLLLETLKASAPARVVTVSSQTHAWATVDVDNLQAAHDYQPSRQYSATKLMNVLFTYELARRLAGSGVTANCLHPGAPATALNAAYHSDAPVSNASEDALHRAAQTSLYLATSPEAADVTGKYFVNRKATRSADSSYDETLARALWQRSAELTDLP